MDEEVEFHVEILENFTRVCTQITYPIIWLCNSIIKLMTLSRTCKNENFIRDSLVLILEHYNNRVHYIFEYNCREMDSLRMEEKHSLRLALNQELY